MKLLLVTITAFFIWTQGNDLRSLLVGNSSKIWIYKGLEIRQEGKKCESGEALEFRGNGKVKIIECTEGVVRTREVDWRIETSTSSIDQTLMYGNEEYLISIIQKQNDKRHQYLRLYKRRSLGDRILIKEYQHESDE